MNKTVYTLATFVYILSHSNSMSTHPDSSSSPSRSTLYRRLAAGELQRIMPGVMLEADAILTDDRLMALLSRQQPAIVMNLISALHYHGMTTQIPDALSVALPRGVRMPQVYNAPVQVWFTKPDLMVNASIKVESEYGPYLVTTPERTIADCFKYRNKIGLSIFLEALKSSRDKLNPSLLQQEAKRLRVLTNILPYFKLLFS
jgi:predicted transcriptional regulator of viral defense system